MTFNVTLSQKLQGSITVCIMRYGYIVFEKSAVYMSSLSVIYVKKLLF